MAVLLTSGSVDNLGAQSALYKPLLCDVFYAAGTRKKLINDKVERVYSANISLVSEVERTFRGEANVHWRLQRRNMGQVYLKYLNRGIDIIGLRHSDENVNIILQMKTKNLVQGISACGGYPINLCAMLYHAGASVAHYCLTGEINTGILTKNKLTTTRPISITCAEVLLALSEKTLFLPTALSAHDRGLYNMLYFLGCATDCPIAIEHALVFNDENRNTFVGASESELAHNLHKAIFYMISIMDSAGGGDVAVLALTAGLHSVTTVISHSDEGGIMRDIFREIAFTHSYGILPPITEKHRCFVGVNVDKYCTWQGFVSIWDYITVATAALVHISDPGMVIGNCLYPTVLTVDCTDESIAKTQMISRLMDSSTKFFELYLYNLCTFWAVDNGNIENAMNIMFCAINGVSVALNKAKLDTNPNAIPLYSRHIQSHVMAPWYWVESSGLFSNISIFLSPLTQNGYGPMALNNMPVIMPAMYDTKFEYTQNIYDHYVADWTTLRRCPLFALINNRALDGICHVHFTNPEDLEFILEGQPGRRTCQQPSHGTDNATCGHRQHNIHSVDEYMWGRRSCTLFHPAECMSLRSIEFKLQTWHFHENKFLSTFMANRDVVEGNICVTLGGVVCYDAVFDFSNLVDVKRQYTYGAKRLERARLVNRMCPDDVIFSKPDVVVKRRIVDVANTRVPLQREQGSAIIITAEVVKDKPRTNVNISTRPRIINTQSNVNMLTSEMVGVENIPFMDVDGAVVHDNADNAQSASVHAPVDGVS